MAINQTEIVGIPDSKRCAHAEEKCDPDEECIFFDPMTCHDQCLYFGYFVPFDYVCWPRAALGESWDAGPLPW